MDRVDLDTAVMAALRTELHKHDVPLLANRIGVSVGCIYSIRNGKTKWPRKTTVETLLYALGFTLILAKRA